jgi:hypothetical protein
VLIAGLVTFAAAGEPSLPPLAIRVGAPPVPASTPTGNVLIDEVATVEPVVEPALPPLAT